jgi:hydroxypyruvate isomerase
MPHFAANLSMMFNEWAFADRFDAAAEAGFDAVECLFPYEITPEAFAERLSRNHLQQALFNTPPGDWAAGERGMAVFPDRVEEMKSGVAKALEYGLAAGVKRLHMLAGIGDRNDAVAMSSYRRGLTYAAERFGEHGIDLVIEPINGRNMPGYFLNDFFLAERLVAELGLGNLKLQFDVYHCQIIHGDVTMMLRRMFPIVGHIQIASVPSRHEPDDEELNYPFIFREIDRLGYGGFVGCEYIPRAGTLEGLTWLK